MPSKNFATESIKGHSENKIKRLTLMAILIASASALQMLESPLPRFFPWLKLGLANVVTLYSIVRLGGFAAISIAALRTCLAAIFIGSLFSPVHLMSFAGAVTAALIMAFICWFSPNASIGFISVVGAVSSNLAQLGVLQIMFASNLSLWLHIAFVIWIGIPTGIAVGKITYELLRRT